MSEEQAWRLIVTEMGIDTRTPMVGKAMAHMAFGAAFRGRASSGHRRTRSADDPWRHGWT